MRRRVWVSAAAAVSRRRRTVHRGVQIMRLALGRRRIFAAGFRGREWRGPLVKRRRTRRPGAPGNHGGYR
jgi:hypothetical protein